MDLNLNIFLIKAIKDQFKVSCSFDMPTSETTPSTNFIQHLAKTDTQSFDLQHFRKNIV